MLDYDDVPSVLPLLIFSFKCFDLLCLGAFLIYFPTLNKVGSDFEAELFFENVSLSESSLELLLLTDAFLFFFF